MTELHLVLQSWEEGGQIISTQSLDYVFTHHNQICSFSTEREANKVKVSKLTDIFQNLGWPTFQTDFAENFKNIVSRQLNNKSKISANFIKHIKT